jgi:hypothetical protein
VTWTGKEDESETPELGLGRLAVRMADDEVDVGMGAGDPSGVEIDGPSSPEPEVHVFLIQSLGDGLDRLELRPSPGWNGFSRQ